MKKHSILHLISSSSFLGAEQVIAELCRYGDLNVYTIHVIVFSTNIKLEELFSDSIGNKDVLISLIPCNKSFDFATISLVSNYIVKNNIKIIHSHGYKADFYSFLISLCKTQNFLLFATVHNWMLNTFCERIYKIIDKFILRRFDRVVTVSIKLCEELERSGFNKDLIDYIPNGVGIELSTVNSYRQDSRCILGVGKSDFVVGCVASLSYIKAQEYLIEAASQLIPEFPGLRVVLIGDGDRRSYLETYADTLNISEYVIFTGYRNDVRNLYTGLDAFALVSRYEGLPMALLEAMAAGVPVVASAVGAIPDVIGDNEFGLLVRPGSTVDIADAVRCLITDSSRRKELSANGRFRVEEKFSSGIMCRAYENLYKKLIDSVSSK